jgi:hypothetical protein
MVSVASSLFRLGASLDTSSVLVTPPTYKPTTMLSAVVFFQPIGFGDTLPVAAFWKLLPPPLRVLNT